MFNTSKLKGRIVELYGSQAAFAQVANRSRAYISLYMSGKRFLDQRDIAKWIELLHIPSDEIDLYFFTMKVDEKEQAS